MGGNSSVAAEDAAAVTVGTESFDEGTGAEVLIGETSWDKPGTYSVVAGAGYTVDAARGAGETALAVGGRWVGRIAVDGEVDQLEAENMDAVVRGEGNEPGAGSLGEVVES